MKQPGPRFPPPPPTRYGAAGVAAMQARLSVIGRGGASSSPVPHSGPRVAPAMQTRSQGTTQRSAPIPAPPPIRPNSTLRPPVQTVPRIGPRVVQPSGLEIAGGVAAGVAIASGIAYGWSRVARWWKGPANPPGENQNRVHRAQSASVRSGGASAPSRSSVRAPMVAFSAPAPEVPFTGTVRPGYKVGSTIEAEDVRLAEEVVAEQNRGNRTALARAKDRHDGYVAAVTRHAFDRDKGAVPTPGGGTVAVVTGAGRDQAYANSERYFPATGAPYREIDVNAGNGTVGNYRLIRANAAVGVYQEWVGFNITHGGGRWIRVWNIAGGYWQAWVNGAAVDLPGHVAGPRPVNPLTEHQRSLLRDGIQVKRVAKNGMRYEVGMVRER